MRYKPVVIQKPVYTYMKLTPNHSIRNTQTGRLVQFIAEMYQDFFDRFELDIKRKQLLYECREKVAYYIYMTNEKIEFYLIVPKEKSDLMKQRIDDVWKNLVTVTYVNDIPKFEKYNYYLDYKYEDALSTRCDSRENDLLSSILNSSELMHDGDETGILFNFAPIYQKGWMNRYNETMKKVKVDSPFYKNKTSFYSVFFILIDLVDKFMESFFDKRVEKGTYNFDLSEYTRNKKKRTIVSTQIVCAGNNKNATMSLCEAFRIIDNDNQIIKYKTDRKMNYENYNLGCSKMLVSSDEAQNFLSLPADSLLKQYKIEHTDILETKVPEELQHGYIRLGINLYHANEVMAYLRDEKEIGAMPLLLIGEQGAGKSTYIANYSIDAQTRGEGIICIDFIKNNELSEEIKKAMPKERVIEIDLSDINQVQGIGYNELKPASKSIEDIVSTANLKALYISRLIDSLGVSNDSLTSRMDRYLIASANVVMTKEDASLKDVVKCLNDYSYRDVCIKALSSGLKKELEEEIQTLRELDEIDKNGKVNGTKFTRIEGVNDRISKLQKDYRLKKMFNKDCKNNVDLVKAMEDGKVVLFKMPQVYFSTPYSKNVIVTYLYTKIWAASLVRGMMHSTPKRCHIITDEVFQCKTAMELLQEEQILPQTRKFQTKFVFSCQNRSQIESIADTIDSAGASYMLMKGNTKANFNEFKDQIAPFTLEDLQALKQYHSLNIINTEQGKKVFTTKLPKPIN